MISDPPSLAEGVLGCPTSLLISGLWGSQYCFSKTILPESHHDVLTFLWTLLCQKTWVGKEDKWCGCLGVFFGIFGVNAISCWIPSFLLPNSYWKVFVFPDICGVSFLCSQCSRDHGLLYFSLHALNWVPVTWLTGCLFYYPCDLVCVLPWP